LREDFQSADEPGGALPAEADRAQQEDEEARQREEEHGREAWEGEPTVGSFEQARQREVAIA